MSELPAPPPAGRPVAQHAAGSVLSDPVAPFHRRATRRVEGRLIGGVAGGVADHLELRVLHVRIAFVVLAWFGGFGAVAYAALWFLLPQAEPPTESPGLASATRQGKRPQGRSRAVDIGQILALAVLGIGVVALVQFAGLGVSSRLFWPIIFAGLGVALIWRQADDAQRSRWMQASPRVPVVGSLVGTGGWASAARFVLGLALVGGSVAAFVVQRDTRAIYDDVLLGVLLALAGVALIFGPLVFRLTTDLSSERRERIRSQERADMAAHLHDSVLQTLALIQKQSADPRRVASLARSQERELRDWLYSDATPGGQTLRSALRTASGEIEDAHGVAVDVVTVGDAPLDEGLAALLRAGREAMVNAAKHAQADKIDVYAEVDDGQVGLFVRDRGVGFDPGTVPPDRLGIRGSIQDRMRRHGGTAVVRSAPGEGTEVRLVMKRSTAPAAAASEEDLTR